MSGGSGAARRVLLSGDEGTGTLAAVRALRSAGYEVWLAVSRDDTYAARSRAVTGVLRVTDPGESAPRHVEDLARAVRLAKPALLLPGTEGSLRALTGREGQLPENVIVATPESEVLERATDKWLLGALARRAGLSTPNTIRPGDPAELRPDRLRFPLLAKPRQTITASGERLRVNEVELVRDAADLRQLIARGELRHRLLQERIEGTLGAVCGVAWNGEIVCAVHQRSPRIWPPGRGSSAFALTVPPDPGLQAGVGQLVREIGWSGIFGVQFVLSGGRAHIIDFNPRIYGSLALAIAAGANLPAIWAALLQGGALTRVSYRVGVGYRFEEDEVRALIDQFRSGRRLSALRGSLPRPRTTHAVFALSDPRPVTVSLRKLAGRRSVRA